MGQPYVGEIRMFAGNFAPAGWALCQGQLMPISENETLFNLIGTTYGGDGQNTFALPNLQSRIPLHMGTGGGGSYTIAQQAGSETVTLTGQQIPQHSHTPQGLNNPGTQAAPTGGLWAQSTLNQYGSGAPNVQLPANAIGNTGGSQPHENMIPYLVINFIISLFGVYPTQ